MRLVCPNCDAQYEVEARLIPDEGRDVQCSSCGDTWFQKSQSTLDAEALEADVAVEEHDLEAQEIDAEDDREVTDVEAATTSAPDEEPEPEIDDSFFEDSVSAGLSDVEEEDDAEDFYGEVEAEVAPEDTPPKEEPERHELDAAVLDVLRQEAELEARAREEEGVADLETQPDLGLQSLEAAPEPEVQERTARLRGIEPEDVSDGSANSRSDLLPDIEEINSTLRAESDRKTSESVSDEDQTANRSGFNYGFSIVIMLVGILFGLYVLAPQLGQSVPAMDSTLKAYVRTVDAGRVQLDAAMEAVIRKLKEEPDVGVLKESEGAAETTAEPQTDTPAEGEAETAPASN